MANSAAVVPSPAIQHPLSAPGPPLPASFLPNAATETPPPSPGPPAPLPAPGRPLPPSFSPDVATEIPPLPPGSPAPLPASGSLLRPSFLPDAATETPALPPGSPAPLPAPGPPLPSSFLRHRPSGTLVLPPSPTVPLVSFSDLGNGPSLPSVERSASVLSPLSDLSKTSPFLAQGLPAASTVLSDAAVEPFHPPSTQSTSFTPLLETLAKDACTLLSDNNVAPPTRKSTRVKEKTDRDVAPPKRDVAPPKRKRISGKGKAGPRKKTSCAKNTPPVVGPKPDNEEPDSAKESGSEVSNSYDEAGPELEVKSMKGTETPKMCGALIGPLRGSPCPSTFSEILDTITLNLPDVHSSVEFETISWTTNPGAAVFKIDPSADDCACSPALLGLQGWVKSVERQVVYPLRTGIYLLAPVALGGTSLCHYHLKALCCCLNMTLHPDDKVLRARLTQVWERRENLDYFLATEEKRYYFLEGTTMF